MDHARKLGKSEGVGSPGTSYQRMVEASPASDQSLSRDHTPYIGTWPMATQIRTEFSVLISRGPEGLASKLPSSDIPS